jgi:hypothetical protein
MPRSGVPANRELKSTTFICLIKVAKENLRSPLIVAGGDAPEKIGAGTPRQLLFMAASDWHHPFIIAAEWKSNL